jgi:hypothetical protein
LAYSHNGTVITKPPGFSIAEKKEPAGKELYSALWKKKKKA